MEKNVKVSILLEIYGELLTKTQYQFLDDYYNSDLSLSEIAENKNITRQAVRDNIKKGENKLFELEEKLKIMQKTIKQERKESAMLENVKNLLSDGVTALGGILIVFGLVNLGLTIKDGMQGGGGQLSGALAMIIGGAIVVGAAVYFKTGINWGSLAG